jgi:hypothetical protein
MVSILWDVLLILLLIASLVAILTGAGLLVIPEKLERVSVFASGSKQAGRAAKKASRFEKLFYRHHRFSGGAIFCSALVILYVFLLTDTKQKIVLALSDELEVFLDAAVAFFVIAGVFAAQIGAAVFIRPSMLRQVEAAANRLISFGTTSRVFGKIHDIFHGFALRYKKAFALFFIAGGLYICTTAGLLLYRQPLFFPFI